MDFSFDVDHLALRDAVRRWCDDAYPAGQRGEALADDTRAARWQSMAGLGLHGLAFDAAHGGSALGAVETMVAATELGRALGGEGWIDEVVLAGGLIARLGTTAQRAAWLPSIADGTLHVMCAQVEPQMRDDPLDLRTTAHREGDAWVLSGTKRCLGAGAQSALLLVVARISTSHAQGSPELAVFAIETGDMPGLTVHAHRTLDDRCGATVMLRGVRVPAASVLGGAAAIGAASLQALEAELDRANAARVADATGAMEALLDLTLEHLRTRHQFGKPLASFQALQHRVADLAIALEQCKSMACAAAVAIDEGDARARSRVVSAAKAFVAQAARRAAFESIQLHGAMGMTDECSASRYARHLLTLDLIGGSAASHLRRFAALHGDVG